jgi:L-iditol 2-dehydrogenase
MPTMRALTRSGDRVELRDVPVPALTRPDDVRVRVSVVGLCRTDLLAAEGKIPAADPVVLGHEFAGVVEAAGPRAGVTAGDRVAVNPVFGCGRCPVCDSDPINCPDRTMLGLDRGGALAEFVVVPAANVFPVPPHATDFAAAYAEPVAAALAVFNAGIEPHHRGLVLGSNRFARLVGQVLQAAGFSRVESYTPGGDLPVRGGGYDFVIETGLTGSLLPLMMHAARPGGTLVLKSRVPGESVVDFQAVVRKQLRVCGVNYGPFRRAVGLLAEGRIDLSTLLGPVFPLADWQAAFAAARSEATKVFLTLGERPV